MRNLKRVLALALALVMTLGLLIIGSSAASYTDAAQINDDYADAIEVLTGMGVFQGMEGNAFSPTTILTRAQASALVYRVLTGDVTDAKVDLYDYKSFNDVPAGKWYTGYVTYAANGGYIKGWNGNFSPDDQVTGVQVLAIMLRAVGYGQNGEFEGAAWKDNTLTTANDLGLLDGINVKSLDEPAQRQLVAQLLFNAITKANIVYYTPALGYYTNNVLGGLTKTTLGYKVFKLTVSDYENVWGQPGIKWTYNTGDEETIFLDDPVYSTTVRVDECDIAEAIGLKKTANIEKAYIDGLPYTTTNSAVTTDRNGKIDPLATTSLVGAQGRLTEVYDMGDDGYRIVEINTYLAQVSKVTASTTDKNGHTTKATINLAVYLNSSTSTSFTNVEAAGYAKGDYVLVTVYKPNTTSAEIVDIEAATVTPTGAQTSWTSAVGTTPATTTVGATTFNDADKFFLGRVKGLNAGNWDTIVDQYGNLIGMVPSTVNYLIVEKIEWEDTLGVVGGGYALADVVLADGTKATVTVNKVNGTTVTNTNTTAGTITSSTVADEYQNNSAYYKHIYSYTVNADGTYALVGYCNNVSSSSTTASHNAAQVTITTGKTSTIATYTNTVVANDNTVFLVADKPNASGTTYTAYYGVDNVPSMTVAANNLCYLSDGTYATLVVVNAYTLASSEFVAYAATQNGYAVGYDNNGATKYAYEVYQAGSTDPTIIYSNTQNLFTEDGIYRIKVDNDKKVVSTTTSTNPYFVLKGFSGTDAGNTGNTYGNLYWARGQVGAFSGNSLVVTKYDGTTTFADYRTTGSTTYFQVTKTIYVDGSNTTEQTSVSTITADQIDAGDRVIVAYATSNGDKVATYVYVLKTVSNGVNIRGSISGISVYVDGIVAGNDIADTTATLSTNIAGVNVPNSVVWYQHSATDNSWTQCTGSNIFVSGYTYRAVITTSTPSGYEYASTVTLTNGSSDGLPNATVSGNANQIVFQFVMP